MYQPEIVYDGLAPEGERLVLEVYTYMLPYIGRLGAQDPANADPPTKRKS
jgi:hypothetical protein